MPVPASDSSTAGKPRSGTSARAAVSTLVVLLVLVTLAAGYLSSWLPLVAGFPAGAIIRDAMCAVIIVAGLAALVVRRPDGPVGTAPARVVLAPLALLAVWVIILTATSHSLTGALLSARNLLLYPVVAVAVYGLWTRGLVNGRFVVGGMLGLGCIAAALGLADTFTGGAIVERLGFRPDFTGLPTAGFGVEGVSGGVAGVVRASGGISDALVFGYLMAFVALVALWLGTQTLAGGPTFRWQTAGGLAAGLALAAMIASLTRGAWVAFAVGLVALILMRPGRAILAASLLAIVLAVAGTTAMSALTPAEQSGNLGGAVADRVGSADSASQLSSQARVDELRTGLETLIARPLGTGLGSEGAGADRAGSVAVKSTIDIYVMIVALQTGIPGLVIWLSGVAAVLAWVVRNRRHGGAPIIGAGLAFGVVASILSFTPDAPPMSLFFWLILLSLAVAASDERSPGFPLPGSGAAA